MRSRTFLIDTIGYSWSELKTCALAFGCTDFDVIVIEPFVVFGKNLSIYLLTWCCRRSLRAL
jgi:hypothetical protein